MKLRGYQRQGLDAIRSAFRSGCRSVLYQLPTGGGKTVVFAAAIAGAAKRGRRVLVLTHRAELADQCAGKLRALGLRPGLVGASLRGASTDPGDDCRVAMIQTYVRRGPDPCWRPDLVVVDEAHLAAAATWQRVLVEMHGDAWRLGVTATPQRLDGQPLRPLFSTLVAGPTVAELQAAGYLVPIRTYSVPGADLSGVKMRAGDFVVAQAADAMSAPKLVGDVVDHYRKLASGRSGIVYASSLDHAARLAAAFVAAGVGAEVVSGSTPRDERADILQRLRDGRLRIVCNYGVLIEGFDAPGVSYIGLARPTASLTVFLQAIGRGTRPAPGKRDLVVCDHAGNAADRFGLPEQDRPWSLDGAVRGPRGAVAEVLAIATCPACLAMYCRADCPDGCPRCGEAQPVRRRRLRVVDGQLVQLTAALERRDAREQSRRTPERPAPGWADATLWRRCEAKRKREGYGLGWTYGVVRRLQAQGGRRW